MLTSEGSPYLSQANFVGEGFDIYGTFDVIDSSVTPLLDPSKAGVKEFNFLGKDYVVPSYINAAEDTSGNFSEFSGETRESFQNNLSERAEVHLSYGAFSGQMEESYSHQFASNSQYSFAYRSQSVRLARLQLIMDNLDQYLTANFVARVNQLPSEVTPENLSKFADFFDDFGIYFTSEVTLGASLDYFVAVDKQSKQSSTEISANVKLDYNAVFWSGGVSSEVKNSQSWQSYSSNRTVNIQAKGGDPVLLAMLTSVDPNSPDAESVNVYNQWLNSIDSNPAITEFKLKGIWLLCGAKRDAVEKAFLLYGPTLRPTITVESFAEPGQVPVITLGGDVRPTTPPQYPQGYQVVVLDRSNPTLTGIKLNKYYSFAQDVFYYNNAEKMYNQILSDLKQGGFDNTRYVLVMASFGMSRNAPPNSSFYGFLKAAGGGPKLQNWVEHSDPGSTYNWWAAFDFVGIPGLGPNSGLETFVDSWNNWVSTSLEGYFYRIPGSTLYSLGRGATAVAAAAAA